MRPPRRLSGDELAQWRKVAETVTPLERRAIKLAAEPPVVPAKSTSAPPSPVLPVTAAAPVQRPPAPRKVQDKAGLDGSWERRMAKGGLQPDFSLDLHGSTLDQAYSRLMHGLSQARSLDARVVLIVTGKSRPTEAADRGSARGAIRAKIIDWLGASEHAGTIAAVRGAHRRHGGAGALYVVLKKRR